MPRKSDAEIEAITNTFNPPMEALREKLDFYFKAFGETDYSCGLNYTPLYRDREDPKYQVEWVPAAARDNLAQLMEANGIKFEKPVGVEIQSRIFSNKHFSFKVKVEGLTVEKIENLGRAVDAEVLRLKGPSFRQDMHNAELKETGAQIAAIFDREAHDLPTAEVLQLLAGLVNASKAIPERAKEELSRKIAAMKKAVEPGGPGA